jgi:ATP-dependent helicase HrpB
MLKANGHGDHVDGPARLAPSSTVTGAELLVAVDAEHRQDSGAPVVRLASSVEPEWLLEFFPERMRETSEVVWNRSAAREEAVSALMFDGIVVEETRRAPSTEESGRLLAEKAVEAGLGRFAHLEELDGYLARAAFASQHGMSTQITRADAEDALRVLASGLRSFGELETAARDGGLLRALRERIPPEARNAIERLAPERIRLPGGRQTRIHYEPGQPPWIASRLQDFFGMRETPAVANGAVPLVVRLLAPNNRPVQTTTDLAGFWERLYPQVRRELSRRYPKHAWPEKPGASR